MPDALGWRMKFGVIAPSTNTIVQPEFDAMRPDGVTNHFGRIHIPNDPLRNDDDFTRLIDRASRDHDGSRSGDDRRAGSSDHGHVVRDLLRRQSYYTPRATEGCHGSGFGPVASHFRVRPGYRRSCDMR
jgi:hypothetical protein